MHKIVILITMLTIHSKPEPQVEIFFVDRKILHATRHVLLIQNRGMVRPWNDYCFIG